MHTYKNTMLEMYRSHNPM